MIDMKKQQVILIRHGKTKGNEEGRYLGKTDLPLSPLGRQEVENSEYPVAEIVFTSPRLRKSFIPKASQSLLTVCGKWISVILNTRITKS